MKRILLSTTAIMVSLSAASAAFGQSDTPVSRAGAANSNADLSAASAAAAQTGTAAPRAGAANSNANQVETIVVTAQRRNENLQDVPIAVTATTSARLTAAGASNVADLPAVAPGLGMSVQIGMVRPHLRGIGSDSNGAGIENPVAIYLDGVYLASSSGSLLSLKNIDRVEVLRGPQGTLFGRNATGGLVQIITRRPSHTTSGDIDLGYGNYDTASIDGYFTGGASDTIAADFAFHYSRQGEGYGTNIRTGHEVLRDDHDLAFRAQILWEPDDATSFRLAGDYTYRKSSALTFLGETRGTEAYNVYNNFFTNHGPYPFATGFYDLNYDVDPTARVSAGGASLEAEHHFGDISLKSITAFRQTRLNLGFDVDATPEPILAFDPNTLGVWNQFSQELQLSSSAHETFRWTAGLYYFHANDGWDPLNLIFGAVGAPNLLGIPVSQVNISLTDRQLVNSYAAYAQATWEFLPRTRLTLGGRYTRENRSFSGNSAFIINGFTAAVTPEPPPGVAPTLNFSNFSYRIALDHNFTPDILGYVSYNTGFKSGGYNPNVATQPPYKSENIRSAEAGLRTMLFDRRVRLNMAAFHYSYDNIQVGRYIGTSLAIYNGAKAELYGADLDLEARLFRGFTLYGGLSYVHNRFKNFPGADYSYVAPGRGCLPNPPGSSSPFNCSAAGNHLAYAPTFGANIGFDWSTDLAGGELGLNSNLSYSSGFFGSVDNNPVGRQKPYELLSASIHWTDPSRRYTLTLWGRNLLDEQYAETRPISPQGADYSPAPPLTFGGTIGFHF